MAWHGPVERIFQRQHQEILIGEDGHGAKTEGVKIALTCSKYRLLFALWAQCVISVESAVLFLQSNVLGLQNISGCCQLKFGFCNGFGMEIHQCESAAQET